jgi:hypothetical protein
MFQQFTLPCLPVHHFDHSTQPVLTRVWDCCKAERLCRSRNRGQHLCRPGHWPLGRNKYQPDHCTWWKQRGRYNQAAGQGNALQLPGNPVAVLAAKDNGDRFRQLQPLRTPCGLGLDDVSHWHPVCSGFPSTYEITEGLVLFPLTPQRQAHSPVEATADFPSLRAARPAGE